MLHFTFETERRIEIGIATKIHTGKRNNVYTCPFDVNAVSFDVNAGPCAATARGRRWSSGVACSAINTGACVVNTGLLVVGSLCNKYELFCGKCALSF